MGDIDDFVAGTLDFVAEIETLARNVAADGPVTLSQAIDRVVEERGDFGLNLGLAFPLSAHFGDLVERGIGDERRVSDVDTERRIT